MFFSLSSLVLQRVLRLLLHAVIPIAINWLNSCRAEVREKDSRSDRSRGRCAFFPVRARHIVDFLARVLGILNVANSTDILHLKQGIDHVGNVLLAAEEPVEGFAKGVDHECDTPDESQPVDQLGLVDHIPDMVRVQMKVNSNDDIDFLLVEIVVLPLLKVE